jgi:hypothetical protein
MSWVADLLNKFGEFITNITTNLNDFLKEINDLTDQINSSISNFGTSTGAVIKILGAIRYIVGDVIYFAFYLSCMFGLFYSIYKLVIGILNLIKQAKLNVFKNIDLTKF